MGGGADAGAVVVGGARREGVGDLRREAALLPGADGNLRRAEGSPKSHRHTPRAAPQAAAVLYAAALPWAAVGGGLPISGGSPMH